MKKVFGRFYVPYLLIIAILTTIPSVQFVHGAQARRGAQRARRASRPTARRAAPAARVARQAPVAAQAAVAAAPSSEVIDAAEKLRQAALETQGQVPNSPGERAALRNLAMSAFAVFRASLSAAGRFTKKAAGKVAGRAVDPMFWVTLLGNIHVIIISILIIALIVKYFREVNAGTRDPGFLQFLLDLTGKLIVAAGRATGRATAQATRSVAVAGVEAFADVTREEAEARVDAAIASAKAQLAAWKASAQRGMASLRSAYESASQTAARIRAFLDAAALIASGATSREEVERALDQARGYSEKDLEASIKGNIEELRVVIDQNPMEDIRQTLDIDDLSDGERARTAAALAEIRREIADTKREAIDQIDGIDVSTWVAAQEIFQMIDALNAKLDALRELVVAAGQAVVREVLEPAQLIALIGDEGVYKQLPDQVQNYLLNPFYYMRAGIDAVERGAGLAVPRKQDLYQYFESNAELAQIAPTTQGATAKIQDVVADAQRRDDAREFVDTYALGAFLRDQLIELIKQRDQWVEEEYAELERRAAVATGVPTRHRAREMGSSASAAPSRGLESLFEDEEDDEPGVVLLPRAPHGMPSFEREEPRPVLDPGARRQPGRSAVRPGQLDAAAFAQPFVAPPAITPEAQPADGPEMPENLDELD